ncbi:hypothetical protein GO287_02047 [Ralstonia solanacearum]|uniref:hypothetical protein n=1 Tax=Ralstonia pseudosolanacearum TaxID=1310165 RepID=UPI00140263AE|nr:hypothetical protein [Ralstonia pseudosolanacearum]KAF3461271.1 hypothetical protein GO278_000771 [Ralstonia solanacearum]NKA77512.1 hypothetical protein [Ralstonia solanacearum]NKG00120.1 hypothetical protein [Ralstonia solanacearum]NKG04837.1 hypothetical protein [Ralstonia solanacearum]UNJ30241.1 hypothetical protein MNY32_02680 [Ralstonia pseudosolanacearum]
MQRDMNQASSTAHASRQYDPNADVAELRKLLSERHADPRKQRFRHMYDAIQELIAAGVSHAAIIRKLKDMGLSVAPITFKSWLSEMQREREAAVEGRQTGDDGSRVRQAIQRG